jgi:hypothetical protein
MKYWKFVLIFVVFMNKIKSQPPCAAGKSNLLVTISRVAYCVGDSVKFNLNPVAPSVISGIVNWQFAGTSNGMVISGPQNKLLNINGLLTSGLVTASGILTPVPCSFSKTFMVNVSGPNGLAANAGPDFIFVGGGAIPLGPLSCVTGGTVPYTILWSPGAYTTCGPSIAPLTSTTYTLNVTDANNCKASDMVLVINLVDNISYIVPKKTINAGYQLPKNNKVYFKFEEEYKAGTLSYKILDYAPTTANTQPATMACPLSGSAAKSLGDNRYYIDINSCGLITSKFYLVEITNDKNEKFYFKFKA